jgi:transposase
LESVNNRLVDMLWGRRSERRGDSPGQQLLNFGDDANEPPSEEEQEIITAQSKADEASDLELLRRLEARRKARRKRKNRNGEFPPHFERRVRRIDLPEEEKKGLKCLRVKVTERLRFEKPHAYVEVIERPEYVVAGRPEEGVRSMPPPLSIVEGCKYDFSVIAAIGAMKFAFHVPTYRQQDWFAQCGWFPSRSCWATTRGSACSCATASARRNWHSRERAGVSARGWTRTCRWKPDRPVRRPATRGCTRAWTAWLPTTCFTGR